MVAKEPWLAVNFSMFFPGLGQIYAHLRWRGLLLIIIQSLAIALLFWSVFSPSGNTIVALGCFGPICIVYLFSLLEAYAAVKDRWQAAPINSANRQKDIWLAIFLSRIIPGLGHLYLAQFAPGIFLIFMAFICLIISGFSANIFAVNSVLSCFACYHIHLTVPRRKHLEQLPIIHAIAIAILISGIITSYIPKIISQNVEIFEIPSSSMLPTLEVGDRILVQKSDNYLPKQGDLIVFTEPETAQNLDQPTEHNQQRFFIKRVIGKPGQTVQVTNGIVYINRQPLPEKYILESPNYELPPMIAPVNSYFVMGDNRNDSFDSHVWGFLPQHEIIGRAYKIYWPSTRIRPLSNPHEP